jgi:hypothetical protein
LTVSLNLTGHASTEANDDDAYNQHDLAIAPACSLKFINEEVSEEDY